MTKTITFSIQKGGTSKTTSVAILSYLLSENYRVLAVDFDSQGNLTELLTGQDVYDFTDKGLYDALENVNAVPYIHTVKENLDLLAGEDSLASFSRHVYTSYAQKDAHGRICIDEDGDVKISSEYTKILKNTLHTVREKYDYILIDTPPSLSEHTINALAASDGVVIIYEASQFCYTALPRFIDTVNLVQEKTNSELKIYGIMPSLIDTRRLDSKAYLELVREEYGDKVFNTVIKRKAAIARLPIEGFEGNKELERALAQYRELLEELLKRVHTFEYQQA